MKKSISYQNWQMMIYTLLSCQFSFSLKHFNIWRFWYNADSTNGQKKKRQENWINQYTMLRTWRMKQKVHRVTWTYHIYVTLACHKDAKFPQFMTDETCKKFLSVQQSIIAIPFTTGLRTISWRKNIWVSEQNCSTSNINNSTNYEQVPHKLAYWGFHNMLHRMGPIRIVDHLTINLYRMTIDEAD